MENKFTIDFIGIGAAKSGTTWVARMLEKHPGICLSEPKEVDYFNAMLAQGRQHAARKKGQSLENKNHTKPISWYAEHFAFCAPGNKKGEFSPCYLYDEKAPEAIKSRFPDVKIIVCLRNPVDRVYSGYWMFRESFKLEKKSFEDAMAGDPLYIEKGFYYKQLSKYLQFFSRKQILVVLFDEIVKEPLEVLKRIYGFVGVDDTFIPKTALKKSNYAKKARFKNIVHFMDDFIRFMVHAKMTFVVKALKALRLNKLFLKMGTSRLSYPKMGDETRAWLKEKFIDDIEKLEKLIDRDLSSWK